MINNDDDVFITTKWWLPSDEVIKQLPLKVKDNSVSSLEGPGI